MNSIFVASLVHDATSRVFPAMNSTHKGFLFCSPTYKRAHKLSSFCIAFACLACTEFNICGQPFSRCHVACLQVAGTLYFVPTPAISTLATTTTADQQQYQHQKSFVGHRNHNSQNNDANAIINNKCSKATTELTNQNSNGNKDDSKNTININKHIVFLYRQQQNSRR